MSVVDGEVVVEYPQAGEKLEVEPSTEIVVETLSTLDDREARLPVTDHQPVVTDSDVDAAAAQVRRIIASDVTLTNDDIDFSMTFTKDEIARAVYTEISANPVNVDIFLDEAVVRDLMEARRSEIELPPVSATFTASVSSGNVTISESRYGTLMDVPGVTAELLKAAAGSRHWTVPRSPGRQAEPHHRRSRGLWPARPRLEVLDEHAGRESCHQHPPHGRCRRRDRRVPRRDLLNQRSGRPTHRGEGVSRGLRHHRR